MLSEKTDILQQIMQRMRPWSGYNDTLQAASAKSYGGPPPHPDARIDPEYIAYMKKFWDVPVARPNVDGAERTLKHFLKLASTPTPIE